MTTEITLSADGERALREAENLCWKTNVAIIAPEHLLGGALVVLHGESRSTLPAPETVFAAVAAACGTGSETLTDNVRFGSAARMALNHCARAVIEAGASVIDAAIIARGVIDSGEVNPMLFSALGTSKGEMLKALG